MNRRRFMKLFGAAAAAGAVPAIAGTNAAIAYAEKQPVEVEEAMRRLVDTLGDLRRPMWDFARQADATALTAAKLEEAMKLMAQQYAVPRELLPTTILTSPSRAAEIRELFSAKMEDRARREWGDQVSTLVRHGDLEVEVRPLSMRDAMEARALFDRFPGGVDIQISPLVPPDALFLMPRSSEILSVTSNVLRPTYAPDVHELGTRLPRTRRKV